MAVIVLTILYLIGVILSFGLYNSFTTQVFTLEGETSKWYTHPIFVVLCITLSTLSCIGYILMRFAIYENKNIKVYPKLHHKLKFTL